jgi:hypothetical protein
LGLTRNMAATSEGVRRASSSWGCIRSTLIVRGLSVPGHLGTRARSGLTAKFVRLRTPRPVPPILAPRVRSRSWKGTGIRPLGPYRERMFGDGGYLPCTEVLMGYGYVGPVVRRCQELSDVYPRLYAWSPYMSRIPDKYS